MSVPDSTVHKDKVKRYFDEDARRYESQRYDRDFKDCHQYSYLVRKRHVLGLIEGTGGSILDLGCGPGVYTDDLLKRGFTYRGVDISSRMIEVARGKYRSEIEAGTVSLEVKDVSAIDYEPRSFDAAVCIGVVSYVPDIDRFLGRLADVLKPGGYVIFQLSKRATPKAVNEKLILDWAPRIKALLGAGRRSQAWDFPLIRYRVSRFDALCERHGLSREKGIHFDYTMPLLSVLAPRVNLFIAERLERWRLGLIQNLLAGDYVARYRKR